jgi:transcription antitermination factor NusG
MPSFADSPPVQPQSSECQHWFAVHVFPKLTRPILSALHQKGFQAFALFQKTVAQRGGRVVHVEAPLFSGYVFVRMDPRYRMPVLTTPGVRYIVGFGKQLVPVAEEEITAIRMLEATDVAAEPWPYLNIGDRVRIVEGPLRGLTGILIKEESVSRIVVGVTLIQRALAIRLDARTVRPDPAPDAPLVTLNRAGGQSTRQICARI